MNHTHIHLRAFMVSKAWEAYKGLGIVTFSYSCQRFIELKSHADLQRIE